MLLAALPPEPGRKITLLTAADGEEEGRRALSATVEALKRTGAALETKIRKGKPAEEILREAEESSPDLVVVGSRGLGRWRGSSWAAWRSGWLNWRRVQSWWPGHSGTHSGVQRWG